jgi:hypothetical protein
MSNEMFTQLPTVTNSTVADIICAVQGNVSTQQTLGQIFALYLANVVLSSSGNPNGMLAGAIYQLCWDKTNSIMYVCTTSGSATTAVWSIVSSGGATITDPAHGGTGIANPTAHSLPIAQGASNFNFVSLVDGQLLIGVSGSDPIPANLSAGSGIAITNSPGGIMISATGSGSSWTDVSGTTQAMLPDNGYATDNSGLVTCTLPVTAAFGSSISIIGKGSGGWSIAQNAGQSIQVGNTASTIGAGGSVSSTNQFDSLNLICTVANTVWTASGGPQGNLSFV